MPPLELPHTDCLRGSKCCCLGCLCQSLLIVSCKRSKNRRATQIGIFRKVPTICSKIFAVVGRFGACRRSWHRDHREMTQQHTNRMVGLTRLALSRIAANPSIECCAIYECRQTGSCSVPAGDVARVSNGLIFHREFTRLFQTGRSCGLQHQSLRAQSGHPPQKSRTQQARLFSCLVSCD